MGYYERIDARGAWETGRPVSFIPKGALTHHPERAVVLPAATVRSARRMRLLREPYVQCHSFADLLSLATQSVAGVTTYTKYRRFNRRYSTNCPHKPATGSFICGMTITSTDSHFLFAKKKHKAEERRDGENEGRFTTWKQRWSAEVRGALRLPLPLI